MSSPARKVSGLGLGSSLEMFVLILVAIVAAAVGEHQSCKEYCNSLKSSQLANTQRSSCNCHPQHPETGTDKNRNMDNPIYYEPVEFHPLPDISFVYQPFIISNPTSSSDDKDTSRSLSSQETEHHRKYKRKDNIIHKISIDSSKHPLYLDIDIKNNPDRSRSSQNHIGEFDDLQITEQDLKDCIDLHLLFHLRQNESDNLKLNINVEHLEKYFHISDADLMIELNKKCKQPSDVVEKSLRHIKEGISVMKPQYSLDNEPSKSYLSEVHHMIPANNLYNNTRNEERYGSNANTFDSLNNNRLIIPTHKEITKPNDALPWMIKLDKLANSNRNDSNMENKSTKYLNGTQLSQNDVKYRAIFNNPKFEHNSTPQLSEKTTDSASTPKFLSFFTVDNKNDKKMDDDIVFNGEDFLRMAPTDATMTPQSREDNRSEKLTKNVNEMFVTTSRNNLASTDFITLPETYLNNGLNRQNSSIGHDINRTFKNENDNDLEPSSSNMEHVLIKNTNYLPEITTKDILIKSKENPRSNGYGPVQTESKINMYDPSLTERKTQFDDYLTTRNELTTIRNVFVTPRSDLIYSENNGTLFTTTELNEFNNITTYMNRSIISQDQFQIPRIFVTEFSNETVDSIVDGTEEMSNDNYVGIKQFEMDVADLNSPKANSIKAEHNIIENNKHNEKLNIGQTMNNHYNVKVAEEDMKTSNISEISGNLYFMSKKRLIPMRFIQNPDGELKLTLDGASFCKNLLTSANDNGILFALCNSAIAIDEKNNCTKT